MKDEQGRLLVPFHSRGMLNDEGGSPDYRDEPDRVFGIWTPSGHIDSIITWRPAVQWFDSLRFLEAHRRRSAAVTFWQSNLDGRFYYMDFVELENMLHKATLIDGTVRGTFNIKKRGSYYSLVYVGSS